MARAATTSDVFNAVAEPRRREILRCWWTGDSGRRHRRGLNSTSPRYRNISACSATSAWYGCAATGGTSSTAPMRTAFAPCTSGQATFERYWTNQLNRIKERAEKKTASRAARINPISQTQSPKRRSTDAGNTAQLKTSPAHRAGNSRAGIAGNHLRIAARADGTRPTKETRAPIPMILEAWPGGRWYRDLGDNNGHFWATCRRSSGRRCSNSRPAVHVLSRRQ